MLHCHGNIYLYLYVFIMSLCLLIHFIYDILSNSHCLETTALVNMVYSLTQLVPQTDPQVDKLIKAGADILCPIPIGFKRVMGTAVDYAYYMFNQVSR